MKTDELINAPAFEKNDALFLDSLNEAISVHRDGCDFFKFLLEKNNFQKIESLDDLEKLPYTMVNLFKYHEIITGPKKNIVLTLGSSGTSGQRSQIFLDQCSLDRVKTLAYNVHRDLGITSQKKYNYLCFTYDPAVARDVGTAFTDELLTGFTDKAEVYYTFQFDGSEFQYDEEQTLAKLKEFEISEYSTRILGFPAFLYELIAKHNLKLNLGEDSWVQTGGGWKQKEDQKIEKSVFRELVANSLGIPKSNIRDLFGMVEHGVPYVDDEIGRLRIPNYARVLIRDPRTLACLKPGEVGLVQFISTYLTSFPSISLLTTDWGRILEDEKGFYLELIGRAGVSKNKGCALKALEMMS